MQVSTDGGLNWAELARATRTTASTRTGARKQVSLQAYTNRTVRLRFQSSGSYGRAPDEDIFLDNMGIGEPTPAAPSVAAPAPSAIVEVVRPTLAVRQRGGLSRRPAHVSV